MPGLVKEDCILNRLGVIVQFDWRSDTVQYADDMRRTEWRRRSTTGSSKTYGK